MNTVVVILLLLHHLSFSQAEIISHGLQWCNFLKTHSEPSVVFYPRMPKCGSSTMEALFRQITKATDVVRHLALPPKFWVNLDKSHLRDEILLVISDEYKKSKNGFLIVDGHCTETVLPVRQIGVSRIENIQLIRDCKSRTRSHFLYDMYDSSAARSFNNTALLNNTNNKLDNNASTSSLFAAEFLNTSLPVNECLNNYLCLDSIRSKLFHADLWSYLCGTACVVRHRGNIEAGLNASIENENEMFAVMGTTNRLNEFLEMLECAYPSMAGIYRRYLESPLAANLGTMHDQPISSALDSILEELCSTELNHYSKFYQHAELVVHERYEFMKANRSNCCRMPHRFTHK